jgi:hypothetical protein
MGTGATVHPRRRCMAAPFPPLVPSLLTPSLLWISPLAVPAECEEKEKREGESLPGKSHVSMVVGKNLGAFVWVLPLEWKHKFGPTKMGVSTQIENGGPDLAATAGVA